MPLPSIPLSSAKVSDVWYEIQSWTSGIVIEQLVKNCKLIGFRMSSQIMVYILLIVTPRLKWVG